MKLEAATLKQMLHTNCNCFECNALKAGIDALTPQADKARGEVVAWMTPEAIEHLAKQNGVAKVDAWNCASGSDRVPLYSSAQPQGDASGQEVDPNRALKDALFACTKAGDTSRRYGGVAYQGGHASVTFSVEPSTPQVSGGGEHRDVLIVMRAGKPMLTPREQSALDAAIAALSTPQARPACPGCGADVLFECVACSESNYPKEQARPDGGEPKPDRYNPALGVYDEVSLRAAGRYWEALQYELNAREDWAEGEYQRHERMCIAVERAMSAHDHGIDENDQYFKVAHPAPAPDVARLVEKWRHEAGEDVSDSDLSDYWLAHRHCALELEQELAQQGATNGQE